MRFGTFVNNYQETQYWEDTEYEKKLEDQVIKAFNTVAIYKDI